MRYAIYLHQYLTNYGVDTYQTYYFELIGQTNAFGLTAISSTLQFLANLFAVCLSDVLPRRKALIGGGTILAAWSIVIGGTSLAGTSNAAANTALLVFMITWSMLYTGAVGCFGWAVAQETASQSTRPKTIAFTLVCQQLTGKSPSLNFLFPTLSHCQLLTSNCSTSSLIGLSILHQPRSTQLGRESHVSLRRSRSVHPTWSLLCPT